MITKFKNINILNLPRNKGNRIEFNSVLQAINFGIIFMMIISLLCQLNNDLIYLDGYSFALGIILCIETSIALWVNRGLGSPFILILSFITIVFYEFRVFSLAITDFSLSLNRINGLSPSDVNFGLIVIIISNAFMILGLMSGKRRNLVTTVNKRVQNANPHWHMLLFLFIIFSYLFDNNIISYLIKQIISILNPVYLWLGLTVFAMSNWKKLSSFFKLSYIILLLCMISIQTLFGSRSALFTYGIIFFISLLVVYPKPMIKKWWLLAALTFLPLLLTIMITIYSMATEARQVVHQQSNMSLSDKVALFNSIGNDNPADNNMIVQSLARIGFLDFTVEIIANRDAYYSVLSPAAYFKSIVDNVITPGFDVYDQPRVSNGLHQIYNDSYRVSKVDLDSAYHSDQLSLFGELYGLLGIFSLPIVFYIGRIFSRLYEIQFYKRALSCNIRRTSLVYFFYVLINSFGIDWLLLDAFAIFISILLNEWLFSLNVPRFLPNKVSNGALL